VQPTERAAGFAELVRTNVLPRLPLRGSIDLTYRCNNNCRHCWLHVPPTAPEPELSLDEVRRIADEARAMGCREWSISGGEPMLRPDFPEIFDYLTLKSRRYTLNTNGTLITPEIARLLRRRGSKMVALYGATAEVHDHITRNPGSFDAVMRGFRYLEEAGAGFIAQLIPMRDNYHQFDEMVKLAKSLSPQYRVGAPWLHLSACASPERNAEISRQRLDAKDVIALDQPDMAAEESVSPTSDVHRPSSTAGDDRLFAACIAARQDFHIDPQGGMTFCTFIKDPALRFDLRKGTFRAAWDEFIPALAGKVRGGREYLENCGSCEMRQHCRWCGVYGFLEHGRYGAKVEYLCDVARENRSYKERWQREHRRYFEIAGITLRVESDLPFTDQTFHTKFRKFQKGGPGPDTVTVRHHFELPGAKPGELGREVYRRPPWAVFRKGQSWIYLGISPDSEDQTLHQVIVFNSDYTRGEFYHPGGAVFRQGNLHSLTLLPTDQILLAQLLADRQACFIHSAGAIVRPSPRPSSKTCPGVNVGPTTENTEWVEPGSGPHTQSLSELCGSMPVSGPDSDADGVGLLFVGHSEAGKSTITKLIQDRAEILCDDRNIVTMEGQGESQGREGREGEQSRFRVYGSWSHGEVPLVSASSAPLRAILFIKQSPDNRLVPVTDRSEVLKQLLACVIRPLETPAWWQKTFSVVEALAREVPCYIMEFDKSGRIVEQVLELAAREGKGQGKG
jgi:MoaA/NifB/PqqE/SkfB family radical SAM enzyme